MSENKDFKDLEERDTANNAVQLSLSIFIGLTALLLFHALYSIYDYATDNSVPLVTCPRSFDLEAPVLMNSITQESLTHDRWIRGFMRRFMTYQFPRTGDDAEKMFRYIRDHSRGEVKDKYKSYVKDIDIVSDHIRAGYYHRFYPKNSRDMRIRKPDNDKYWIVEIDGWLVSKYGIEVERSIPTLRYKVEVGTPTLTNPEGLYVVESNVEQIIDYVSGRKKGDDDE